MATKKYYAVQAGRVPGIYTTWNDCQKQVVGYKGAKFKSFPTQEAAQAKKLKDEFEKNEREGNNLWHC